MSKRFNYDVLSTKGDISHIYTKDKELIDLLDQEEFHTVCDYWKNDRLIAKSFNVPKQYLSLLRRDYLAKIY